MTALLDTVAMALGTLRANPLRSLLTLLGIFIGASTVVAMMSLTEGLRLRVNESMAQLGSGSFQVQKWPVGFGPRDLQKYAKRRGLTREQGEALRALPHVRHVSIEAWFPERERIRSSERQTQPSVNICGGLPDYEHANAVTVSQGRFLSDVDVQLGRRVVFLGPDVADVLFPGEPAVGREVRIRSTPFTVIGVSERTGSLPGGGSNDAFVVFPITVYDQVMGRAQNHNIAIQAVRAEDVGRAIDEVVTTLRRLRNVRAGDENDFEIFTNDSVSETFNNIARVVAAATFAVCALALLVGGIGIMNIMLVSVTERTREIGVRMALGARRRRILAQFVVEAMALAAVGGVAGALAGAALAVGAREVYDVPARVPAWAVALSLAAACGSGLVFGIYPAARASRLDPVEAMRTE